MRNHQRHYPIDYTMQCILQQGKTIQYKALNLSQCCCSLSFSFLSLHYWIIINKILDETLSARSVYTYGKFCKMILAGIAIYSNFSTAFLFIFFMYHSRCRQSILMIVSIGPYYRSLDVDTRLELFFFATHHVVISVIFMESLKTFVN